MPSQYLFTPQVSVQRPRLHSNPPSLQYYHTPRISTHVPIAPLGISTPGRPNKLSRVLGEDPRAFPPPNALRSQRRASMDIHPNFGVPPGRGVSTAPSHPQELPPDHHSRRHSRRQSLDDRNHRQPAAAGCYAHHVGYKHWTPPLQIHPLLKGDSRVLFDIASPSFGPVEIVGPRSFCQILPHVLAQAATDPPTTRLAITCDTVPQWSIHLDINAMNVAASVGYVKSPPPNMTPIKLGDVLHAIHTSFQTPITHTAWAHLSETDQTAVARAYRRRCRAFPSMQQLLASQGVRLVDYLLKTSMFAGLVLAAGDAGNINLKLIVAARPSR